MKVGARHKARRAVTLYNISEQCLTIRGKRGNCAADVKIALREGYLNAMLFEFMPDGKHYLTLRQHPALRYVGHPEMQQKIDGTVGKGA